MYTVSEIKDLEIPDKGLNCLVKGFFYYRISSTEQGDQISPICYLAESESVDSLFIELSKEIGETVISDDETFGMMVGGEFAYFGLSGIVDGIIKSQNGVLTFTRVESLKLEKDGESQKFYF